MECDSSDGGDATQESRPIPIRPNPYLRRLPWLSLLQVPRQSSSAPLPPAEALAPPPLRDLNDVLMQGSQSGNVTKKRKKAPSQSGPVQTPNPVRTLVSQQAVKNRNDKRQKLPGRDSPAKGGWLESVHLEIPQKGNAVAWQPRWFRTNGSVVAGLPWVRLVQVAS
jgi:hypothetical protein